MKYIFIILTIAGVLGMVKTKEEFRKHKVEVKRQALIKESIPIYPKEQMKRHTAYIAKKVDLDPKLALALVEVESRFNHNAVSPARAIGLTQVIYKWHKDRCNLYSEEQLKNPTTNLYCGLSFLKTLINKYGSLSTALTYYNTGEYASTRTKQRARKTYTKKVLNIYKTL